MDTKTAARARINSGKIRHTDIKMGLLSDDEVAALDVNQIYQWVRNGQWKLRDFRDWLRSIRVLEDEYFARKSSKKVKPDLESSTELSITSGAQ